MAGSQLTSESNRKYMTQALTACLMSLFYSPAFMGPLFSKRYGIETQGPSFGGKRSAKKRNKAWACGRA